MKGVEGATGVVEVVIRLRNTHDCHPTCISLLEQDSPGLCPSVRNLGQRCWHSRHTTTMPRSPERETSRDRVSRNGQHSVLIRTMWFLVLTWVILLLAFLHAPAPVKVTSAMQAR